MKEPVINLELTHDRTSRLIMKASILLLFFSLGLLYILLALRHQVDSDSATALLQAWDMYHGNWNLHGWKLVEDSYWLLDVLLYVPGIFFIGFKPTVIPILSGIIFTSLVAVAIFLAVKEFSEPSSAFISASMTFFMLNMSIAFIDTAFAPNHYLAYVYILASLALINHLYTNLSTVFHITNVLKMGLAIVLTAFATVSDPLVYVVFILPIFLTLSLMFFKGKPTNGKKLHTIFLFIILACLLNFFIIMLLHLTQGYVVIPSNEIDQKWFFISADKLSTTFLNVVQGILSIATANFFDKNVFKLDTIVILLRFTFLSYVFYCVVRAFKKQINQPSYDLVTMTLILGFILNILACIFSKFMLHSVTVRYLLAVIIYGAIITGSESVSIIRGLLVERRIYLIVPFFILGTILSINSWTQLFKTPLPHYTTKKELLNWLTNHNLYFAYGTFWASSINTVLSEGKVVIRPIGYNDNKTLAANACLINTAWYTDKKHKYQTLIWTDMEFPPQHGQTLVDKLISDLGKPKQLVKINDYHVAVWDYDLSSKLR